MALANTSSLIIYLQLQQAIALKFIFIHHNYIHTYSYVGIYVCIATCIHMCVHVAIRM